MEPELKDRLDRLDQGLTDIRRLISGNGGVGLAEQVRTVESRARRCAERLAGHLDTHQGRRGFWAEKAVYLTVTLAAVALTAWLNH